MVKRHILLCLIMLYLMPTGAWSFDVDGFRSGMSRGEVFGRLEGWRFDKLEEDNDKGEWSYIRAWDYKTSNRAYHFGFCSNRLHLLQRDFDPSMRKFIVLFDTFSSDYGKPNSYVSRDIDRDSLSFKWNLKSEYIELTYTVFENNDQLSVLHSLKNDCPKTTGGAP